MFNPCEWLDDYELLLSHGTQMVEHGDEVHATYTVVRLAHKAA